MATDGDGDKKGKSQSIRAQTTKMISQQKGVCE